MNKKSLEQDFRVQNLKVTFYTYRLMTGMHTRPRRSEGLTNLLYKWNGV